jgi:hypothetical protein
VSEDEAGGQYKCLVLQATSPKKPLFDTKGRETVHLPLHQAERSCLYRARASINAFAFPRPL